jgi:hypothetical protein
VRIIRDHYVYGKEITVEAATRDQVYVEVRKLHSDYYPWEMKEISPGKWLCYVAKHQSCFAVDD